MGTWADITTDPATGHTVAKDWFKACAFVLGTGIVTGAAVADCFGVQVRIDGAVLLLSYAFAVGATKAVEGYFNRKTTDDTGSPLVQPGTAEPPGEPLLMPQPPAPAAPTPPRNLFPNSFPNGIPTT